MSNRQYAGIVPTTTWRSAMTLPSSNYSNQKKDFIVCDQKTLTLLKIYNPNYRKREN